MHRRNRYLQLGIVLLFTGTAVLASVSRAEPLQGDPERGKIIAYTCHTCHYFKPGPHHTGPNLHGVFGRRAGTAPGYKKYSEALKKSTIRWSAEELDQWLANPRNYLPGSTMVFIGITDPQRRADLIAWLEQATR